MMEEFDLRSETEKFARLIGENVRRFREEKKWTQDKLAEELGISRLSVSKLERGEVEKLNISNIVMCAKLFGCSVDVFFIEKNDVTRRFLTVAFENLNISPDDFGKKLSTDYSKLLPKRSGR